MHNEYRNPVMRHLRDQLTRYAPRQKKVEQIGRAEKLIGEIDLQVRVHEIARRHLQLLFNILR